MAIHRRFASLFFGNINSAMPNPFPGVNPYIDASGRWPGFHNAMITYCGEVLNAVLPSNYAALIEERVELVEAPADRAKGSSA